MKTLKAGVASVRRRSETPSTLPGVGPKQPRPWATSLWAAFICVLVALVALFHGQVDAMLLMLGGAAFLLVWAVWLVRHEK